MRMLEPPFWIQVTQRYRIGLYFTNMTAFSLFHRPTFDRLVYSDLSPNEACCLVAAMFSYSARFLDDDSLDTPDRFYDIACELADSQLRLCGDKCPPLSLLQALVLTSFYGLIAGLKGIAWRSLGTCMRIAHEMDLHLVDAGDLASTEHESSDTWRLKEERRRIWWVTWELEVFASVVRRAPASMQPFQNATLLPIDDASWFESHKRQSCFLLEDPTKRWKALQASGNTSSLAWFIVINSFTRDAHTTFNPVIPRGLHERGSGLPAEEPQLEEDEDDNESKLCTLENCVACFVLALPAPLRLRGLQRSTAAKYPDACEGAKHLISMMVQLTRLMIFHRGYFMNDMPEDGTLWYKFVLAAEEIVKIIRESPPCHVRTSHPLLLSTYWMVAAIQLVRKSFARTPYRKQLAQSNYDLMRLTIEQYCQFWKTDRILLSNLEQLERKLAGYSRIPDSKTISEESQESPIDHRRLGGGDFATETKPTADSNPGGNHRTQGMTFDQSVQFDSYRAATRDADDAFQNSYDRAQVEATWTENGSSLIGQISMSDFEGAFLNPDFPISMTDIFSGAWQNLQPGTADFAAMENFLPL